MDCLNHRKQEHSKFVPDCTKDSNGRIIAGSHKKNSLKRNGSDDDDES